MKTKQTLTEKMIRLIAKREGGEERLRRAFRSITSKNLDPYVVWERGKG